jgi:AcrR family transcriptional regulator
LQVFTNLFAVVTETLRTKPSPTPRRTERLSASDRWEQILREAMECFGDLGFRGTTTRLLAERVGISETALHRYFTSKEALYTAIIDQKMAALDRMVTAPASVEAFSDIYVMVALIFILMLPAAMMIARHAPGKYAPIE